MVLREAELSFYGLDYVVQPTFADIPYDLLDRPRVLGPPAPSPPPHAGGRTSSPGSGPTETTVMPVSRVVRPSVACWLGTTL